MTVQQALRECKQRLSTAELDDPAFEARCLIEKVLGLDRAGFIAHGKDNVDEKKLQELLSLTERRARHEPLQYLLGSWSFCGLDFFVGDGVLIPRDDTEVVFNLCAEFLKDRQSKRTIDLCAGSGAISVALSVLAKAEVTAIELSDKAFPYLIRNIEHNKAQINTVKGDILTCFEDFAPDTYDLIVSNPPYIKSDEIPDLQPEVCFEPTMALDGGEDGCDFYRAIIKHWSSRLKNGGALAFELGEGQSDYVSKLMSQSGFTDIKTAVDFGGTERAIIGIYSR